MNLLPFFETEDSLPYSKHPATSVYPEPDKYSEHLPTYFLNIHFNVIMASALRLILLTNLIKINILLFLDIDN